MICFPSRPALIAQAVETKRKEKKSITGKYGEGHKEHSGKEREKEKRVTVSERHPQMSLCVNDLSSDAVSRH